MWRWTFSRCPIRLTIVIGLFRRFLVYKFRKDEWGARGITERAKRAEVNLRSRDVSYTTTSVCVYAVSAFRVFKVSKLPIRTIDHAKLLTPKGTLAATVVFQCAIWPPCTVPCCRALYSQRRLLYCEKGIRVFTVLTFQLFVVPLDTSCIKTLRTAKI